MTKLRVLTDEILYRKQLIFGKAAGPAMPKILFTGNVKWISSCKLKVYLSYSRSALLAES